MATVSILGREGEWAVKDDLEVSCPSRRTAGQEQKWRGYGGGGDFEFDMPGRCPGEHGHAKLPKMEAGPGERLELESQAQGIGTIASRTTLRDFCAAGSLHVLSHLTLPTTQGEATFSLRGTVKRSILSKVTQRAGGRDGT